MWRASRTRKAGNAKLRTTSMVFCAAFNCSNNSKSGVSFFTFPLKDEQRCKEWVRLMKRKDFIPTNASRLCSAHFSVQSFEQNLTLRAQLGAEFKPQRLRLKSDAVPTIFNFTQNPGKQSEDNGNAAKRSTDTEHCRSAFAKRRKLEMLEELLNQPETASDVQEVIADTSGEDISTDESVEAVPCEKDCSRAGFRCQFTIYGRLRPERREKTPPEKATPHTTADVPSKTQAPSYSPSKRSQAIQTRRRDYRSIQTQTAVKKTLSSAVQCSIIEENIDEPKEVKLEEVDEDEGEDQDESGDENDDPDYNCYEDQEDKEWSLEDLEEDIKDEGDAEDDDITDRVEENAPFGRKFLVFQSSLFELFQQCSTCLAPSVPKIQKIIGTMVVIEAKCCKGHTRIWKSQQCDGTLPWGNMLCAAGTLFTGSNPTRVVSFFRQIGMSYISLRAYFYLQKLYLIPAVNSVWNGEQQSLLTSFQGKVLDVGGDARCDSPGHCAKYGAYHLVELSSKKVLTVELVQSNEVKNPYHMELEGLKRGLAVVKNAEVTVATLITDRHSGVKKYMRINEEQIDHRFDCWHLSTSTKAHKELEAVVSKPFLLKDLAKISSSHQTSMVEVLHKVDIYFAPKHTHFFYQAMKARLQIAALHFNENSDKPQRKVSKGENVGTGQWLISYPKYRKGGAVAKEIKVACTYDYVTRLFDAVRERRQRLPSYRIALRDIQPALQATPKPLTTQQTRELKEVVVARHKSRFNKD
ncbi:hypothetical protein ACROYT_G044124 [Oculina patagonica]